MTFRTISQSYPCVGTNAGLYGGYSGSYTIDIEYDLENMPDVQLEFYKISEGYTAASDINLTIDMTDRGTQSAKLTLSGQASAYITVKRNRDCTISPQQDSDKKDVGVSDLSLHVDIAQINDVYQVLDFIYSADANNVNYRRTNDFVSISGTTVNAPDEDFSNPWEAYTDMYERWDDAKGSWKISIVPTGKN